MWCRAGEGLHTQEAWTGGKAWVAAWGCSSSAGAAAGTETLRKGPGPAPASSAVGVEDGKSERACELWLGKKLLALSSATSLGAAAYIDNRVLVLRRFTSVATGACSQRAGPRGTWRMLCL